MKRVIILGAGISGLSCAYFLKQKYPQVELYIFEKKERYGGWVETLYQDEFLFELGPRGFRPAHKGHETLKLIKSLGITKDLVFSSNQAYQKYIYTDQMEKVGWRFFQRHHLLPGLLKSLYRPLLQHDVSIKDFFSKTFSPQVAKMLVDPIVRGIFAGQSQSLSLASCFPNLYEIASQNHCLLWSLLKKPRKTKTPLIYSFRKGMQTLLDALVHTVKAQLFLNHEVSSVGKGYVESNNKRFEADLIISTLPIHVISSLCPSLIEEKQKVEYKSVKLACLGYHQKKIHPYEGFGYLVPSFYDPDILGMTFDDQVFQDQISSHKTRMTLFLEPHCTVLDVNKALKNHLQVHQKPDYCHLVERPSAICQYPVGYHLHQPQSKDPSLVLIGTAFEGVGINDCICLAKQTVQQLKTKTSTRLPVEALLN